MKKFFVILRLSDNSYLTNRGPWEDQDSQWSKDFKFARRFFTDKEISDFVKEDKGDDSEENYSQGWNQLADGDFLILTGFSTKEEE